MKKGLAFILLVCLIAVSGSIASAADPSCDITVTLLNQDPYPAVPGEYVKVVFQLDGIEGDECGRVDFEIVPEFPFSLNPGAPTVVQVVSGTQLNNFDSTFLIPFELLVDPDAVDGANPIDIKVSRERGTTSSAKEVQQFNIEVNDVGTDFEITVQNYDPVTEIVTFEIINVGENDVEALTVDIPKQENIKVRGTNREIIGDLDSGEDTTFRFDASMADGNVELQIRYNDQIGERRVLTETVEFDSSSFVAIKGNGGSSQSVWLYLFLILAVFNIAWFLWKRRKKRKERLEKFNKGRR